MSGLIYRNARSQTELLREQGYDAIHLAEENLERMTYPLILEKAKQEERILLPIDLDFAQLLAISGDALPSVIFFRLGNVSREVVNDRLLSVTTYPISLNR